MTEPDKPPIPQPANATYRKPPPRPEPEIVLDEKSSLAQLLEALLKAPRGMHKHLATSLRTTKIIFGTAVTAICLFGLLLGTFSGGTQLWAAPLKVLSGIFLAATICFPSLCIFTALDGRDVSPARLFQALLMILGVIGLLLVSFAPVVWIFSQSTDQLSVVGTIILLVWIIALAFGLGILRRIVAPEGGKVRHFISWCAIFAVVTFQMSTALRPIIGTADTLLPKEKKFFLEHWFDDHEPEDTSIYSRK